MLDHISNAAQGLFKAAGDLTNNKDFKAMGTIASASGAAASLGSVTVATVTTAAPGILGAIGLTTTSVVALPAAGVVAAAGLIGYGIHKGVQMAQDNNNSYR